MEMNNKKIIKCQVCGRETQRTGMNQKYCNDCRKEVKKNRQRLRMQMYRKDNKNEILEKERLYRNIHKKQIKERSDRYYTAHKQEISKREKKRRRDLRLEVINHYSNGDIKCACCGEKHIEFLIIDHIYGNGNKHRKEIGKSSTDYYRWIIKNNFPNIFQILCHNCNMAKGFYGYCPHELGKEINMNHTLILKEVS